ncbi:hypothetical protein [Variovorax sp. J22R115]|uniref:hypothetical protein n=1 Tax=Variovorax sp. J22R115 TaxID=3053509 RepID=UPI0025753E8B|nr:hypothetical protein [Variovorax sp. J22R115]MDM0053983.1 hypothetical protein [Variovorax sp. J22R115]
MVDERSHIFRVMRRIASTPYSEHDVSHATVERVSIGPNQVTHASLFDDGAFRFELGLHSWI